MALPVSSSAAAAAAAIFLGADNTGLTAGQGHTIANRYGYTDLLLKGQGAAGSIAVRCAGNTGAALAGHCGRPHDGGGIQRQRRSNIHTLSRNFIAAAGRA